LRAGLHVLAEAQCAVADHAIDGSRDDGVAEIESGLVLDRFGVGRRRLGLDDLGVEQIDLLQCGSEISGVARQRRVGRGDARLRLLRVLHAARSARGQIGIALVVLRGERHVGLVDQDGRPRSVDHGLLDFELGLLAGDHRLGGSDIGAGLIERDPVVAVVDPRQHLAGFDALIVLDQHLLEITGDLRRDGGAVSLDVGIVGGDQILADGPVVPAIPPRTRQHGKRRLRHQQFADIELFHHDRRRHGCDVDQVRGREGPYRVVGWNRLLGPEGSGMDGHGARSSGFLRQEN